MCLRCGGSGREFDPVTEAWDDCDDCKGTGEETAFRLGVLQPGWMLDPACDHEYAPCPFCPPIRV